MSLPRLGQQSQAVPWESPSEITLLSDLPIPSDEKLTVFCLLWIYYSVLFVVLCAHSGNW
jgi:hypothetical protein